MNPEHSVEDRAALGIINEAMASGRLRPGGTVVEGTAGMPGRRPHRAWQHAGAAYRDDAAVRRRTRCACSAPRSHRGAGGAVSRRQRLVKYSARLADALRRARAGRRGVENNFDNVANRDVHRIATTAEIWADTRRTSSGFVSAVGSGRTPRRRLARPQGQARSISMALANSPGRRSTPISPPANSRRRAPPSPRASARGRITRTSRGPP